MHGPGKGASGVLPAAEDLPGLLVTTTTRKHRLHSQSLTPVRSYTPGSQAGGGRPTGSKAKVRRIVTSLFLAGQANSLAMARTAAPPEPAVAAQPVSAYMGGSYVYTGPHLY